MFMLGVISLSCVVWLCMVQWSFYNFIVCKAYSDNKGIELNWNIVVFRYTLQASTFQMAILLQYNTEDSYTVQQLTDSTQIKIVGAHTLTHTLPPPFLTNCLDFGSSDLWWFLFAGHSRSSPADSVEVEAAGEWSSKDFFCCNSNFLFSFYEQLAEVEIARSLTIQFDYDSKGFNSINCD